mgnify:FL=1
MRIAVIADTHFPRRGSVLPEACRARIAGADLLVHAGDLADMAALAHLRGLGPPLVAVHGNVDEPAVRAALPATAEAELNGLRLAVVHDAGPEPGRPRRLRARFPRADVVVFGHSHIPYLLRDGGMTALNPGSPTDRRRQPRHSMAEILLGPAGAPEVRFWDVDPPGGLLPAALVRAPRG